MSKSVSEFAAFFQSPIQNEMYMVVHQTECRYHHLAFKKAHSYDVHGGNERGLVFEKGICTETVRKQMIESSFLHICQY